MATQLIAYELMHIDWCNRYLFHNLHMQTSLSSSILSLTPHGTPLHIGIAGAGVLGRLLAWRLARAGHRVVVFDPAASAMPDYTQPRAAGFTAAGMLSPLAELECANAAVAELGWRSMVLWREYVADWQRQNGQSVYFAQRGSLLLAHGSDMGVAQRLLTALQSKLLPRTQPLAQALSAADLADMEPGVSRQLRGWLLPDEGQIHTVQALLALAQAAEQHGAHFHWGQPAQCVQPHTIDGQRFDWVFDVRGLGARDAATDAANVRVPALTGGHTASSTVPPPAGEQTQQLTAQRPDLGHIPGSIARQMGDASDAPQHSSAIETAAHTFTRHVPAGAALPAQSVRGVRGEVFTLHAPGVVLHRPVRLIHPRHRVYVVPRPGDVIVVGASEIESEDRSPISLRSTVELLAAAHAVLPELTEARIIHSETNLRPSLPDNLPAITVTDGLVRINGLFRHGWLIAPALVEQALQACGMQQDSALLSCC